MTKQVSIEVSEDIARWITESPIFRTPGATELRDAAVTALALAAPQWQWDLGLPWEVEDVYPQDEHPKRFAVTWSPQRHAKTAYLVEGGVSEKVALVVSRAPKAIELLKAWLEQTKDPPAQLYGATLNFVQEVLCQALTAEAVCDILALALEFRPAPEEVIGWPVRDRQLAVDWAGAIHVAASDNEDVQVPPEPVLVQQLRATREAPHLYVPAEAPGTVWDEASGCAFCGGAASNTRHIQAAEGGPS